MTSDLTPMAGAPSDFDALALMHLDGLLDPAQHENLSRQIASDPDKATRLAMIAELHAALVELGRTSIAQPLPHLHPAATARSASSVSARTLRHARRAGGRWGARRMPAWGYAAAALVMVGLVTVLMIPGSNSSPAVLHVLQGNVSIERGKNQVRLTSSQPRELKAGDRIHTIGASTARITTGAGDRIDLATGSQLDWVGDGAAIRLGSGALTADIRPRPADAPFIVRTPKADLLVIGTRFTVQADAALSLLAVDHGRVRLTNRDDTGQVEVAANQLTVTTGAGELTTVAGGVPSTATSGLTGDYFAHDDFTGWRLRRVDATIDFDWGTRGPHPLIHFATFSVRWRGWLVPPVSGTYTLTFLMDDGVRLWLDERLVLDEWHLTEKLEFSTVVTLEGGRAYPVRVDFFQQPRDAVIRWYAAIDGQPRQTVPGAWLRPLEWTPPAN